MLVYPPRKGGVLQDLLNSSAEGAAQKLAAVLAPVVWHWAESLPRVEAPGLQTR